MSKGESLLSSFEKYEEALLYWTRQRVDASAQLHKCASSFDPLVRREFEAFDCIKYELCLRHLFSCFGSDWSWPHMECADHIASHAPYVGVCECAALESCFDYRDLLRPVLVLRHRWSFHRLAMVRPM